MLTEPFRSVGKFLLDIFWSPEPLTHKRKIVDSSEFIPSKYARIDADCNSEPGVSGLNRRSIHSASRQVMQSKETLSDEDDCAIIAEYPKGSSQSTRNSKNGERPRLSRISSLPPTRFSQGLAKQDSPINEIFNKKLGLCEQQDSEDEIELGNDKSEKSDHRCNKFFRTDRKNSLSASKNRRRFELDLKRKLKNNYPNSYRFRERIQYEKLLETQMGPKRFSLPSSKPMKKSVVHKSTIPVIDLTEEKTPVRINRTRESVPQTSSAKNSESDIEIIEEVRKVTSFQDVLKVNPVDQDDEIEEFFSRFSKLPTSSRELARLDDDDIDDGQKSEKLALTDSEIQSSCHELEERMRNYMHITASDVSCCCVPDFTEKQRKKINSALISHPAGQVLVEQFGLQITRRDIQTLKGANWLNDEVINFYMQLIMERSKQNNALPKIYAFNTFFYPKLITSGHSGLKRWTKKVDIFLYDIILIPVHLGMHWCMAAIDFRQKEIRYYDSMGSANNRCLQALLYYLEAESKDKKNKKYDTSSWEKINMDDIPQQMNGSDCGVFSCMFAEHLSRDAPVDFTQVHMPYFRSKMVLEIIEAKLLIS